MKVWKMIFLFNWVIFWGSLLIFKDVVSETNNCIFLNISEASNHMIFPDHHHPKCLKHIWWQLSKKIPNPNKKLNLKNFNEKNPPQSITIFSPKSMFIDSFLFWELQFYVGTTGTWIINRNRYVPIRMPMENEHWISCKKSDSIYLHIFFIYSDLVTWENRFFFGPYGDMVARRPDFVSDFAASHSAAEEKSWKSKKSGREKGGWLRSVGPKISYTWCEITENRWGFTGVK